MEYVTAPETKPEPNTLPQTPITPPIKKKFPLLLVVLPVLTMVGIGAYLLSSSYKPNPSSGEVPTPTATPAAAAASGWVVRLSKGSTGEPEYAQNYVLINERGAYLGDTPATSSDMYSRYWTPCGDGPVEDSSYCYSLTQDNAWIVKSSMYWGTPNKPELLEIAPNTASTPSFTKLVETEGAVYLDHLGNGSHLYAIETVDPKCDGICPSNVQLVINTNGVEQKAKNTIKWLGAITTFVSDQYVVLANFWEGSVDFFVLNRQTLTVTNLKKQLGVVQDDYYSMAISFDSKTNTLYYVSEQTSQQIAVSKYDLLTNKKTLLATLKDDAEHLTPQTALGLSPSKKFAYLAVTDSSSDRTTLYSINTTTGAMLEVDGNFQVADFIANSAGTKALAVVNIEEGDRYQKLVQIDFTNEALPQVTDLNMTGLPHEYTSLEVKEYR